MTTFGEINEPGSRTAWEDWDDGVSRENFTELRFDRKVHIPREIETFIILEGRYIYDCMKAHNDLELINSIPEVNLRLYKTAKSSNYVCVLKDYNVVLSSEIVELLKNIITVSNEVLIIMTKPLVEYQVSEVIAKDYVLRSISTTKPSNILHDVHFPRLEQPNIIAGVSAGVLSWREVIDKSALAVVCYIEHPEEQIQEIYDLLEKFKVIPHVERVYQNSLLNSNLYI